MPAAEAKALFLTYDPASVFGLPEPRILIADSSADPFRVGSRIAFARRVGRIVGDRDELAGVLEGHRVRFRRFDLGDRGEAPDPGDYLDGLHSAIDLQHPEYELTLVRGEKEYLVVTAPGGMNQGWARRRPRLRPFFHPSAIFPKLSRALVNLSRCREGAVFLDPFGGTGSIPIEAGLVGARVIAMDVSDRMARGSVRNMRHFGQNWLGVVRADSTSPPLLMADAVATDIPYGRASSTAGRGPREIIDLLLPPLTAMMVPRSHAVIMHPQDEPVPGSRDLRPVEEHHLHVHKLLTRTITILERR